MLVFASAVIIGSESRWNHDHMLLFQIRDSPNLEGHVPVFISPTNRVAQLYPQALYSFFVASNSSQGYEIAFTRSWLNSDSKRQSYVTTNGQSASLSLLSMPHLGPKTRFLQRLLYCRLFTQLLLYSTCIFPSTKILSGQNVVRSCATLIRNGMSRGIGNLQILQ
jgi:hypothetical protein